MSASSNLSKEHPTSILLSIQALTTPHEVDVHVGRAHTELAYVLVKGVPLKPFNEEEITFSDQIETKVLEVDTLSRYSELDIPIPSFMLKGEKIMRS